MNSDILIQVKDLKKHFPIEAGLFKKKKTVYAVNGVDFSIKKGSIFGLVGESGCGKSTIGRLVLRLLEPTTGSVYFKGENILNLSKKNMNLIRKNMQIIFQNPYSSLNPKMRIESIIGEPMYVHNLYTKKEIKAKVFELIELVGLDVKHANHYPHEFSGGQRQRIAIARAIAINPLFILADEPVSALDVSIRLQILNLMKDLHKKFNLTYLFISHDLGVIKYMCDTVAVMYLGKILEMGDTYTIFNNPMHPYTQALISAIPSPNKLKKRIILKGEIPSAINPPNGCNFHTRCPYKKEICMQMEPEFIDMGDGHFLRCHLQCI